MANRAYPRRKSTTSSKSRRTSFDADQSRFSSITALGHGVLGYESDEYERVQQHQTEFEYLEQRARLHHLKPRGILAINTKTLRLDTFELSKLDEVVGRNVYIRIHAGRQVKTTIVYDRVVVPARLIFDDLKHYKLTISDNPTDALNYVKFEIVVFKDDLPLRHRILSAKEIHLHDILRALYAVQTYEMRGTRGIVGYIDLEFCFAYGDLGYGLSNQFQHPVMKPWEQVVHSMFCRLEPPKDRLDPAHDVIVTRHVGHPRFLDFVEQVDLVPDHEKAERKRATSSSAAQFPHRLMSRIGDKLDDLLIQYHAEKSRMARLQFVNKLINSDNVEREITSVELKVSHRFKPLRRPYKLDDDEWKRYGYIVSPAARHERVYQDEPATTYDVSSTRDVDREFDARRKSYVHKESTNTGSSTTRKWSAAKGRLMAIIRFGQITGHKL